MNAIETRGLGKRYRRTWGGTRLRPDRPGRPGDRPGRTERRGQDRYGVVTLICAYSPPCPDKPPYVCGG